jgi:hypothetical protein
MLALAINATLSRNKIPFTFSAGSGLVFTGINDFFAGLKF